VVVKIVLSLLLASILAVPLSGETAWSQSLPADLTKLSIEDLMKITIESVSRFEQKVVEAPASVTIITSDDIRMYGYRNLADILKSVRGLYVGDDRNYSYLGMRGFSRPGDYNTRFLLLVDGHRMNDNIFDYAAIGNDFILDIDLIDRVEIIRGPTSSVYGTNAFLGTINVKTKTGKDLEGAEVSGEGGRFSTYKGRLTYGNKFENGLDVVLSGSRYGSHGDSRLFYKEFNSPTTNFGVAEDADGEALGSFFGLLSFHGFTLAGGYNNREKQIPTAAFGTIFNTEDTKTIDKRGFLDLKYDRQFFNQLGFKGRIFYDYYYYRGDYIYDYADPGDPPFIVTNRDVSRTDSLGADLQLTRTLFQKHKFILGVEYQHVFRQNQRNDDIDVYLDDKRRSYSWAIYLQDEFEVFKNFRLSLGARYDRFSLSGGTINPRAALVYLPFEKTVLKLLFGQAFRAPNVYELFYSTPASSKASRNLDPETIRTVELVAQQYLGFNLWGSTNLYYQRIDDLITLQRDPSDGLLVYRNVNSVEQKGVEFELEGRWETGFRGRVSYALQNTKDRETGKTLTNSPTYLVKLNGVIPILRDNLFLGLEEQYTSHRKTLAGNHVGGYWITNITLFNEKLVKGLVLSASIYNLLGKKYGDPGSGEHEQDTIKQDGRSFRFKLTFRY
jgi:iron complex outermembrane receptor protein